MRLVGIAPEAQVILVVCEPVRRAWSGINHMVKGYAIRHNLMPSSPNEEPTAANRAEMLGVWQGLVDGILRVLERLVLPSGSAFDKLLLCRGLAEGRREECRSMQRCLSIPGD